ncbi:MAG: CoA transferase [Rhodospirillaceae bacterium]|jgi:succinate---hydroxymethylglutarate CoA-transferase|nr:CoA transferase [Rhodospirillaceae bacterium]MBT3925491.1 CoA transferase [Rhodospirillaceae bacterium]MBT4425575.1 CoA transferase [Rhodospirillaceae bacterium]MBT5039303.1 CoA transferase [Rhodospirillaceae bacterium]MBT5674590.1 CoA transferase [Rhodospirillaceae bacterium]
MATPSLPLRGLKLITIEQYGAAPFGTMYLADLGAEVIKIENHHSGGEMGRHVVPYSEDGDSLFFQTFSCNKKCIALDLQSPAGHEVLERLVSDADALINNLRGDLPAKLGLDYAALSPIKADIVCVHLSAYGRDNERAAWPGLDYVMQAEAGYLSMTGEPDSPPTRMGLSIVDFMAGLTAALALLAGVMGARSSGKGQDYDTSLFDVAMGNLSYPATWHLNEGFEPVRMPRSGHPSLVPSEMYQTADGYIFIMTNKANFWPRLCQALDKPEWIDDPRMVDFQARLDNREKVVRCLESVFVTRSTDAWLERLHGQLPCAPVNNVKAALAGDFAAAQRSVQSVPHPTRGEVKMVRQPILIDGEVAPRRAAPALGADTAEVLSQAGYSDAEIATLEADGVVALGRAE